jgi:hypothetical protein
MRIKLIILLSIVLLFAACKKDGGKSHVVVTVKSGSVVPNVYVSLLTDQRRVYWSADSVSAKSDVKGQLRFDLAPGTTYYLYHDSYKWMLDPTVGTHIIIGKFASQQDINNSPAQTPAGTVGGDKYQDIEFDGAAGEWDMVIKITAPAAGKTLNIDFPVIVKHP